MRVHLRQAKKVPTSGDAVDPFQIDPTRMPHNAVRNYATSPSPDIPLSPNDAVIALAPGTARSAA